MSFTVEYLIILPKKDSFCDSVETFNRLLQVDSSISIQEGVICHKGDFSCDYRITGDEVAGQEQQYYHLRFSTTSLEAREELADRFAVFLKTIRSIIMRFNGQVETLWDDISFYYAQQSYPIIHEIESLMRKLIANFMLVTIGKNWINETSPSEVQEAISRSKRKDYVNILHTIDFIDLASFLIKPYSRKTTQELYAKLKKAQTEQDLKELKEFAPQSNWQRYFAKLVACEDGYLNKRWEELYELRCKVAHNAIISRADRDRIVELADDLRSKLQDAINKLPQVRVPKGERETVAENAAANINSLFGEFITLWRILERRLSNFAQKRGFRMRPGQIIQATTYLYNHRIINQEQFNDLQALRTAKNHIVHASDVPFSEADLRNLISDLIRITNEIDIGEIQSDIDELFPD